MTKPNDEELKCDLLADIALLMPDCTYSEFVASVKELVELRWLQDEPSTREILSRS